MVVFAVPGSSPICWGVSSFYRLPRFPALIQFPLENSRPLQKNWWTNQKLRYIKSILPKQSCNNVQWSPYWNKKFEFHRHPSWNRACTYDGFLYRLSSLSICVTISDLSDSPHHREKSEFLSRLYGITAVKFVALRALVRWLAWFLSIYCPVSFEFVLVSSFNIFLDRLVSMLSLFYRIGTKKFLSSHSRFKGPGSTRILYRMVLI